MIKVSQIDSNLSIYQNKKVILWDSNQEYCEISLNLLEYYNIDVMALCDENESVWGDYIQNTLIISPKEMLELIQKDSSIIVQTTDRFENIVSTKEKFDKLGIVSYLFADEVIMVLKFKIAEELAHKNNLSLRDYDICVNNKAIVEFRESQMKQFVFDNIGKDTILICLPPKTGDNTLNHTFDKKNIKYYNAFHCVNYFETSFLNSLPQKIKIITAVREPISQNLSVMFQLVASIPYHYTRIFANLPPNSPSVLENGGDAQFFFDNWLSSSGYMESNKDNGERPLIIQNFIPYFQKHIIDIMEKPFQKTKGYDIISLDNIEVFVYQLERMNDILPEVSKFVGVHIDEYVMGNVADTKWIAKTYKQAQKEIKFSKAYFDKCFNEPYVKHFYSDEDIEKFKVKWKNNIID